MNRKSLNRYLILFAAIFIMFLPRRIYIAGVFSFRAIILGIFLLVALKYRKITVPRIVSSPFTLIYILYSFAYYCITGQITSGIGFLVDTLILICLMASLIRDEFRFDYFIDCFIIMLTVYDIMGIIETLTGFNIYDVISGDSSGSSIRFGLTRFCGAGLVSSNNANFLLLASIIVLYRILHCDDEKKRKRYIAIYVLNAIALCCTLTRAPIMLFFALQVVWLAKAGVFRLLNRYFLWIIIAAVVVVVMIVFVPQINTIVTNFTAMFEALFNASTADSISSSFGSNARGTGERLQLYEWVTQQIKGSEIFGKGPNTAFMQEWTTSYGVRVTKNSLENHYLMVLYQFGAVGLVTFICHFLYMLFSISHLGKCVFRQQADKWNICNMVSWGIITMIPAMFVTGLFDELRMLYIMIALSVSYALIAKTSQEVRS